MEEKIREIVARVVGENESQIKSIDVEELTVESIGTIRGLMELVKVSTE